MTFDDFILNNPLTKIKKDYATKQLAENYIYALRISLGDMPHNKIPGGADILRLIPAMGTYQTLLDYGIVISRDECEILLKKLGINNINTYQLKHHISSRPKNKPKNKKKIGDTPEPGKTYRELFGRDIPVSKRGNLLVSYAEFKCVLNLINDGLGEELDVADFDNLVDRKFEM